MLRENEKQVIFRIERDDGKEFTLGTGTDWKIHKDAISDWNNLDYTVNTYENVMSDGSTFVGSRVNEKDRTLSAEYNGTDSSDARERANMFFVAGHTYKAHVTYMGNTRWCEGKQMGYKPSTENIYEKPSFTWTLLCLDPFMRGENNHEESFSDSRPMAGFPYVAHSPRDKNRPRDFPAGTPASIRTFDGKNTVYNTGALPTNYRVVIRAYGNIVNPKIAKDGKHVELQKVMNDGDVLVIDFNDRPPSIMLNGEDVMQFTTHTSNFEDMIMNVGANVFTFTCENMEARSQAKVQVLFNESYMAV